MLGLSGSEALSHDGRVHQVVEDRPRIGCVPEGCILLGQAWCPAWSDPDRGDLARANQ